MFPVRSPRALLPTAFTLLLAAGVSALWSQEQQAENAPHAVGSFGSGVGTLRLNGRTVDAPLPYTVQLGGPMVALAPVTRALGAGLSPGPLAQGYQLEIAGDVFLLGPDSNVMTRGETILPLSQRPILGAGGIEVPLDLLEQSFGATLGIGFHWLADEQALEVFRGAQRELTLQVDDPVVYGGGGVTLLFDFDEKPSYQVERDGAAVVLRFPGAELKLEGALPRPEGLVASLQVASDRIRVEPVAGAWADDPYLVQRDALRQIVVEVARRLDNQRPRQQAQHPPLLRPASGARIVIDPGHGGTDTGAQGPAGTLEKDITLVLAKSLRQRLEERLPVRVILTRDTDVAMDLPARTATANENHADLLISLHLNSAPGLVRARGAETYILDRTATDDQAAAVATFENEGGGATAGGDSGARGGAEASDLDLQLVLWDLAQNRHLERSLRLASAIQEELNVELDLRDRGVKQAPFAVLVGATMPAVLVELGFLTNPEEEARLNDAAYRRRLVDALAAAIVRFRAREAPAGLEALAGALHR